jgi:hypothetical protein
MVTTAGMIMLCVDKTKDHAVGRAAGDIPKFAAATKLACSVGAAADSSGPPT